MFLRAAGVVLCGEWGVAASFAGAVLIAASPVRWVTPPARETVLGHLAACPRCSESEEPLRRCEALREINSRACRRAVENAGSRPR